MGQSKFVSTPYDELTYKIIGCAMASHRGLGPGLREDTYQRDLEVHLARAGLALEAQKLFEVYDSLGGGGLIGYYIPDFVIDEKVIVEIKAVNGLNNNHLAQVISYLAVSGNPLGLLINFGERSLRYRRILPPQKVIDHQVTHQWLFIPDWLKNESDK